MDEKDHFKPNHAFESSTVVNDVERLASKPTITANGTYRHAMPWSKGCRTD